MRPRCLLPILACVGALVVGACSNSNTSDTTTVTSAAPTTVAAEPLPLSSTTAASTITTTTGVDKDAWVLPAAATLAQAASTYCDLWPEVDVLLAESVVLVDVPTDGWTEGQDLTDDLPAGVTDVVSAIGEMGVVRVECSDRYMTNGDWIAIPVTMHYGDGAVEEGLWSLQISPEGLLYWQFIFASPSDSEAQQTGRGIEVAAGEFCGLFEGTGERDPEAIIGAMAKNPAIHNIINKRHYVGQDAVEAMVPQYLPEERITCGSILTNGDWSANGWALDNEGLNIHLVGLTVQKHTDDRIERQYVTVTQLTGATPWGDYIWGADAAGRSDQ